MGTLCTYVGGERTWGGLPLHDPAHGAVVAAQHGQIAAARRRQHARGPVRAPGHCDVSHAGHSRDGGGVFLHHAAEGARAQLVQSHGAGEKAGDEAVLRRMHGSNRVCLVGGQTGPGVPPGVAVVHGDGSVGGDVQDGAAECDMGWGVALRVQGAKGRDGVQVIVVGQVVQGDSGVTCDGQAVRRRRVEAGGVAQAVDVSPERGVGGGEVGAEDAMQEGE